MTEHDNKMNLLIDESKILLDKEFHSVSGKIRTQLMTNRETIDAFSTYMRFPQFNSEILANLNKTQHLLEEHFESKWMYKIINPYNLLKVGKVYSSQAHIFVEWHAGHAFHHIFKHHLLFHENGFMSITADKPGSTTQKVIERVKVQKKDYRNLYEITGNGEIKFTFLDSEFEGKLLHDSIIGKNIKIGEYKDGLVKDHDEIFVLIE